MMTSVNIRPSPCVNNTGTTRLHAKFHHHTSHHFGGIANTTINYLADKAQMK